MTVPWTYYKFRNCWSCRTLKRKFCHLTKSSHWLHWKLSWWQFRQNDNISVSLNSICRCSDDQVPTTKLTHSPSTKWPPFTGRHFQMHFHEWKALYLIRISLKFVPNGPINSIDSNNGLAPIRRQAIISINAYPVQWCIYAALGGDELIHGLV